MTEEQLAKLPRWAQREFARIEGNVRTVSARLALTLVPAEPDRPAYGDYDDNRGNGLPCRTVWFPGHGISVRASSDGIEIHGDGEINITPRVSNVITVKSARIDKE